MNPDAPQLAWRQEITAHTLSLVGDAVFALAGWIALGVVVVVGAHVGLRRLDEKTVRVVPFVAASLAVLIGVNNALQKASLVDDAFISFRFARNLALGHGLVFNVGERVEGIENFLWTVIIAVVVKLSSIEAPLVGLTMAVMACAANIAVVFFIARALAKNADSTGETRTIATLLAPVACVLLAFQDTFTTYGTTGLEASFASLLVNVGVFFLVERRDARGAFFAGLALVLAALTRLDHVIFLGCGGLTVVVNHARTLWNARTQGPRMWWTAGLSSVAAFLAPMGLFVVVTAWKMEFYGEFLPNTFAAKAFDTPYWEQGEIYVRAFFFQSHFWWVALVFVVAATLGFNTRGRTRTFFTFAVPACTFYFVHVWRIGGDFMHGRLFVTLIPLLLVGATQILVVTLPAIFDSVLKSLPRDVACRAPNIFRGVVVASLFVVGGALPFYENGGVRWHLLEERMAYPVTNFAPLTVGHHTFYTGELMGLMATEDIRPVLATTSIGIIGYYGGNTIIDRLGRTDKTVAHQPLKGRSRPGHEKYANREYLVERHPHFIRGSGVIEREWEKKTRIDFGKGAGGYWNIWTYDQTMMRRLRSMHPEIDFVDFEAELDAYIARLSNKTGSRLHRRRVEKDLVFFRRYYFDHNHDEARLNALLAARDSLP